MILFLSLHFPRNKLYSLFQRMENFLINLLGYMYKGKEESGRKVAADPTLRWTQEGIEGGDCVNKTELRAGF